MKARRSKARGTIVVVVAMSLSLLAVVGLYAFSSAQRSVRGAGSVRAAAQSRGVAEHAIQAAAELVNPASALWFDRAMIQYAQTAPSTATECSSIAKTAVVSDAYPAIGKRCFKQDQSYVGRYLNEKLGGATNAPLSGSVSAVQAATPTYSFELSDPSNIYVGLAGSSVTRRQCMRRYTVTVRALLTPDAPGSKPTSRVGARGRVMSGPLDCGS